MLLNTTGFKINSDYDKDTINGIELAKFSYFKAPIRNTKPERETDLQEAYDLITSGVFEVNTIKLRNIKEPKAAKDFKASKFDYASFGGTFLTRNEAGLKTPSNHFIIDNDHLGEKLPEVRQRIINDTILCPQLVFISPRGDGIKTVVKINPDIINYSAGTKIMNPIWQAVNSYFAANYADVIIPNANGDYIDPACKDVSRACFLCHDATAYLNLNDNNILGSDFIIDYPPILTTKPKKAAASKQKVNPATTLEMLAERHLQQTDNHHPQLLAFIGAAKSIGKPIDHTIDFLLNKVHVSPQSSESDPATLRTTVEDIYSRYGTDSEGIEYLTPLSFGYRILYFKYVKDIKTFVVSSLFWDAVRNILHDAGFAKRRIGKNFVFIQKKGCIIREISPENMRDYFTDYVTSIEESFCFTYQGEQYQIPPAIIRETYLKNSNSIFNPTWLQHLQIHDAPILKDKEKEMFFLFQNGIVSASKEQIELEPWDEVSGFCVWEEQIIKHDFHYVEDYTTSNFYKFLRNVTNHDDARFLTMSTGIGYLLHHYFRESEGQCLIFYDESITDVKTPQGGSGKGLIVNAIKQLRNTTKIDGKHLDISNRFRWEQVSPSTQVLWLDDAKPDFDFSMIHSNLTDGLTIERKYLSQFLIQPKDSPKTVICSNSIIRGGGSTNRRRQFIIELSDFYSRQIIKGDEKPIERTHGCLFFDREAWKAPEWNMFFSVMLDCAYQYLNDGLVHNPGVNVELNRFRQATNEDFVSWAIEKDFERNIEYDTKQFFNSFVSIYYGETHLIAQRTFTGWLKEYAAYKNCRLDIKSSHNKQIFIISGG
jgi:hypothetical protein